VRPGAGLALTLGALLPHYGYNHAPPAAPSLAQVRIEVYPWLTELLGGGRSQHLIMDMAVSGGETVRQLLSRLAQEHPDFAARAFDAPGTPSTLMSLFLNDLFLELAGGLDVALSDGDSLTLIPAWEGGQ